MMTLTAVQTIQCQTAEEYEAAKPQIARLAAQLGAAVEFYDAELRAEIAASQELERI